MNRETLPPNEQTPSPEQAKKKFIEQLEGQAAAFGNLIKLGCLAGFLGNEDVAKIRKSFEDAGWKN